MNEMKSVDEHFLELRPRMFALAYKLTRRASDAEDVLQDVFLNVSKIQHGSIQNPEAYFIRSVTNRCMEVLQQREKMVYPGPDLPEPLLHERFSEMQYIDLSYGMMVLLQKLSPQERAVFILRETMELEYDEISGILNITNDHCRQLLHRSKDKLAEGKNRYPLDEAQLNNFFRLFIQACNDGNLDALTATLKQDITLFADGGGKVAAAINPLYGPAACLAYMQGLYRKWAEGLSFSAAMISGSPGIMLTNTITGACDTIILLEGTTDGIAAIYFVRNPDKLNARERIAE